MSRQCTVELKMPNERLFYVKRMQETIIVREDYNERGGK